MNGCTRRFASACRRRLIRRNPVGLERIRDILVVDVHP